MYERACARLIRFLGACLFLTTSACGASPGIASRTPPLPLPIVNAENAAIPVRSGKPVANSLRAWHYRPAIVKPLAALVDAVLDENRLPERTVDMLIVVVASRNRCLY